VANISIGPNVCTASVDILATGVSDIDQTYATRKIVATVVKSGDANQVVERMKKALGGKKAVVMISPVDDLVMI
jgi:hypothetical protein